MKRDRNLSFHGASWSVSNCRCRNAKRMFFYGSPATGRGIPWPCRRVAPLLGSARSVRWSRDPASTSVRKNPGNTLGRRPRWYGRTPPCRLGRWSSARHRGQTAACAVAPAAAAAGTAALAAPANDDSQHRTVVDFSLPAHAIRPSDCRPRVRRWPQ